MENGRRARPGVFGRRSDPGRCEDWRAIDGRDGIDGGLGADVAEQTTVLVGAVLLMLGVERAPLAQNGKAEEDEQTNGPSVPELSPSLHASLIIREMLEDDEGVQVCDENSVSRRGHEQGDS